MMHYYSVCVCTVYTKEELAMIVVGNAYGTSTNRYFAVYVVDTIMPP